MAKKRPIVGSDSGLEPFSWTWRVCPKARRGEEAPQSCSGETMPNGVENKLAWNDSISTRTRVALAITGMLLLLTGVIVQWCASSQSPGCLEGREPRVKECDKARACPRAFGVVSGVLCHGRRIVGWILTARGSLLLGCTRPAGAIAPRTSVGLFGMGRIVRPGNLSKQRATLELELHGWVR